MNIINYITPNQPLQPQLRQVMPYAAAIVAVVVISKKVFDLFCQQRTGETVYHTIYPFPKRLSDPYRTCVYVPGGRAHWFEYPLPIADMDRIDSLEHKFVTDPQLALERMQTNLERAKNQQCSSEGIFEFNDALRKGFRLGQCTRVFFTGVVAEWQGHRAAMEDAFFLNERVSAVFDGHGPTAVCGEEVSPGRRASQFAKQELVRSIKKLQKELGQVGDLRMYNALRLAFVQVSRQYAELGGTTANIAWIEDNDLYVANVGDSRAIVVAGDEIIQVSEDAKLRDNSFRSVVEERGGSVIYDRDDWRVDGAVAMATALGDHHLLGHMSAVPTVVKWTIPHDDCYLIQASDGLWDVASTNQIGNYFIERQKEVSIETIADELMGIVKKAFQPYCDADNTTILIKRLKPCPSSPQ